MSIEDVQAAILVSTETEKAAFQVGSEALSQFDENIAALGQVAVAMDDIIRQIMNVKTGFNEASGTYNMALEEAGNATDQLSDAVAGSNTAESEAAIGAYKAGGEYLDETGGKVAAAAEDMDDLIEKAQFFINAINEKQGDFAGLASEASTQQPEKLNASLAAAEAAMGVM